MVTQLPILDMSRTGPDRTAPAWPEGPTRTTQRQDYIAKRAGDRGYEIETDLHNVLVLNYTMKCPLACDFCCYSCGPRRTETMELDLALDLVDQAARLGVFAEVSFTGGEPFAYYDEILRVSERIARHGLPFSVISACQWATGVEEIDRLLRPLIDNGMTAFTVSHDPSHERWVPRDQVQRVAARAAELGLRTSIYGTFYDDVTQLEDMFPEFAHDRSVALNSRIVGPQVGRVTNKRLPSRASFSNTDFAAADTCYKRVYHDVTVFWDGEVYPCCSIYNRQTPGISYGNVYSTPLWQIWDRIEGSLFLRTIKRSGFRELYDLLGRLDPELARELPDPEVAIGPCHLCHTLMSDTAISSRVHEVLEVEERRRLEQELVRRE